MSEPTRTPPEVAAVVAPDGKGRVVTLPGVYLTQQQDPDRSLMRFRVLGFDRGRYYFLPAGSRQLREFSAAQLASSSRAALLELAELSYWEREFPGESGFTGRAVTAAVDWLIRSAQAAGAFRPEMIRGRGCWWDRDRLVVHAGDRLIVDGQEVDLWMLDTRFVYELGPRLEVDLAHPLAAGEGRALFDLIAGWGWRQGVLDATLLTGWMVCAVACGALVWRPHLFVTAGSGTGKSTLLKTLMRVLENAAVCPEGNMTTEPGIRQALGTDVMPVIYDEAEPSTPEAVARAAGILAFIRSSSTESPSRVLKGGSGGTGQSYAARSMFLLGAVVPSMTGAADESRISVLDIEPLTGSIVEQQARFLALIQPQIETVTAPGWTARLLGRVFARLPTLLRNAERLAAAAAVRLGSHRAGEQVGPLLAGTYLLFRDDDITPDAAIAMVNRYAWREQLEVAEIRDEDRLLAMLLERRISVSAERTRYDVSLGELVAIAAGWQPHPTIFVREAAAELGRHGMIVDPPSATGGGWLIVSNSHGEIARMLEGSAYHAGWWRVLRRIEGAESVDRRRFAGVQSRATGVPLARVGGAENPAPANNPTDYPRR